ncbi:AAA family ATPase [Vagococcus teuberi]|nr:AAA family ATPase [Vagococcus teuberi]
MIIWINGAFGAGKTTVATELVKQIQPSFLYDPENIGDLFRSNLPISMQKSDFQYYPEWRQWNVHLLKKIYQEYEGDIIVPMTIYKTEAVSEILGKLREENIPVCHIQLDVSKETIISRLQERPKSLIEWGESKVDEILEAFKSVPQHEKINNSDTSLDTVIKEIIEKTIYIKNNL